MLHRFLKITTLSCLTLIVVLGGVLGWHFLASQAQGETFDLSGWQWSDNYGWISLNSDNVELIGEFASAVPYKVTVAGGSVSGWGWTSNAGWVCFGKTCDPNNICEQAAPQPCDGNSFGNSVPDGGWRATIDFTTHKIEGWGKVISLKDSGLVHFGMGTDKVAQNQSGVQCYDCQPQCDVWNYEGDPPVQTTCQTYSATNYDSCNTCFTRTKFDGDNIPDRTVDSASSGSGNICFTCSACQKINSSGGESSRVACDLCTACNLYGGASDSQTGGSLGWSWNGNDDGTGALSKDGAGWIQAYGKSGIVFPWLQTQYGSVFGSNDGSFRQRAAVSGNNSTYCIFAQDVFNFTSLKCANNINDVNISFPRTTDEGFSYQNALGRLDIYGLSTPAKIGGEYNKYGNIIRVESGLTTWSSEKVLDNKVYFIDGDLTIASGFKVMNGSSQNGTSGNGLVIVKGDLHILNDFTYGSDTVDGNDLKRLASVAWIVKGDIIIDGRVKQAVGAMIALGADGAVCQYSDGTACSGTVEYPKYRLNHYGVFSSGASGNPLVIYGLLMAKAFNFERTFSNIQQGSEKIIYDGRLIANPPPGLKNLLEILPVIRDFEY